MKTQSAALIMTAQEQTLNTRSMKAEIYTSGRTPGAAMPPEMIRLSTAGWKTLKG